MTDPRHQFDDHEGQHDDSRDGEHVCKALALTERGTRVSDEPQREQSAKQPDRGERLEVGYSDDLGDKISRQPSNGDQGDEKPQASPLIRAYIAE
jgi:hypothetical protein